MQLVCDPEFGLRKMYHVTTVDFLGSITADAYNDSSRCIGPHFFRAVYDHSRHGDFNADVFKQLSEVIDRRKIDRIVQMVDYDFDQQKLVPCIKRLVWKSAVSTTGRSFRYMRIPHLSTIGRAPSLRSAGTTVREKLKYISRKCQE